MSRAQVLASDGPVGTLGAVRIHHVHDLTDRARRHRGRVCSVLEHGFRDRVLRRHGFPVGALQQRDRLHSAVIFRDWALGDLVMIELDGRLHDDTAMARDADFDRDLETAADGRHTLRISYGQVCNRPRLTAATLVRVLRNRRIDVRARACRVQCPVR